MPERQGQPQRSGQLREVPGNRPLLLEPSMAWWVVEEGAAASDDEFSAQSKSWFVNPYLGVIRGEATPPDIDTFQDEQNYRITVRLPDRPIMEEKAGAPHNSTN